jgi:hypothetical protein
VRLKHQLEELSRCLFSGLLVSSLLFSFDTRLLAAQCLPHALLTLFVSSPGTGSSHRLLLLLSSSSSSSSALAQDQRNKVTPATAAASSLSSSSSSSPASNIVAPAQQVTQEDVISGALQRHHAAVKALNADLCGAAGKAYRLPLVSLRMLNLEQCQADFRLLSAKYLELVTVMLQQMSELALASSTRTQHENARRELEKLKAQLVHEDASTQQQTFAMAESDRLRSKLAGVDAARRQAEEVSARSRADLQQVEQTLVITRQQLHAEQQQRKLETLQWKEQREKTSRTSTAASGSDSDGLISPSGSGGDSISSDSSSNAGGSSATALEAHAKVAASLRTQLRRERASSQILRTQLHKLGAKRAAVKREPTSRTSAMNKNRMMVMNTSLRSKLTDSEERYDVLREEHQHSLKLYEKQRKRLALASSQLTLLRPRLSNTNVKASASSLEKNAQPKVSSIQSRTPMWSPILSSSDVRRPHQPVQSSLFSTAHGSASPSLAVVNTTATSSSSPFSSSSSSTSSSLSSSAAAVTSSFTIVAPSSASPRTSSSFSSSPSPSTLSALRSPASAAAAACESSSFSYANLTPNLGGQSTTQAASRLSGGAAPSAQSQRIRCFNTASPVRSPLRQRSVHAAGSGSTGTMGALLGERPSATKKRRIRTNPLANASTPAGSSASMRTSTTSSTTPASNAVKRRYKSFTRVARPPSPPSSSVSARLSVVEPLKSAIFFTVNKDGQTVLSVPSPGSRRKGGSPLKRARKADVVDHDVIVID